MSGTRYRGVVVCAGAHGSARTGWGVLLGFLAGGLACAAAGPETAYRVVSWDEVDKGSHRAIVRVDESAPAVRAHIPWRRRDLNPGDKDVRVFAASTGDRVTNVVRIRVDAESGDIVFEPAAGPGLYEVYYLPFSARWSSEDGKHRYSLVEDTADPEWLAAHHLDAGGPADEAWRSLPEAAFVEIQARTEFDRFTEMEVMATAVETRALLEEHPGKPCLLFPEDRTRPIRMSDHLPLIWTRSGPQNAFQGEAQPNEYYVFQVGVYAARGRLGNLALRFGDLTNAEGRTIPASALTCFNTDGVDWLGQPFSKEVAVRAGTVQALWMGVDVPRDAWGRYEGEIAVVPEGAEPAPLSLAIEVGGEVLEDRGDGELWRHSRLRWLNSSLNIDDEVVPPYTPVQVSGSKVGILNREIRFARTGLPESIRSNGIEILARPVGWRVLTPNEGEIAWRGGDLRTGERSPGAVVMGSAFEGGPLDVHCESKTEFDGSITVRLRMTARKAAALDDVRLDIPIRREVATYMMGFSREGGYRPATWKWEWRVDRCDQMVWLGDVRAGLHCKLKDDHDTWEWLNLKRSGIPSSWDNEGRGGAAITEHDKEVLLRVYTGPRKMAAGEELDFRFRLMVTPFRPIDPDHWDWRWDVNMDHLHHAAAGKNSFINYPFLELDGLCDLVDTFHDRGHKLILYHTVRELSNHAVELWALRSLGHEVFEPIDAAVWAPDGTHTQQPGTGYNWLREHLQVDYVPMWVQLLPTGDVCASFAVTGLSRLHNWYIESIRWLVENTGIDGLYLDGIGYDREVMKRVSKTLGRLDPDAITKFHAGNNFGYTEPTESRWVSPLNQNMGHLPYLTHLWCGEMFDYEKAYDYWLVEISGIPFGLTSEMLGRGNDWRGMVFGMTGRHNPAYRALLQFWDEFGIQDAEWTGYWDPACPVRPNRNAIRASVYKKPGRTLIAVASWENSRSTCELKIDWDALGIDRERAKLTAPEIEGLQAAAEFPIDKYLAVEPGGGHLLLLEEAE